ncbi:Zona pellucida sperm-binding protein 3, partial [Dissostichus eleginoides]
CWWGTKRPLLLLDRHCVPFQSPPPLWFPYHWVGWLCDQWGSPTTEAGAFSTK